MSDWFSNLIEQFQLMPAGRRIALAATAAGSLAFFLWLAGDASSIDYRMLYRGLAEEETFKVAESLADERIPYRIEEGGTSVYVPAPMVYEARMRVASRGLPIGNSSGFEIFDNSKFGVTDFVQKINYQRAVAGELARSIQQLDAVERARVQIANPPRSKLVRKDAESGTASVVLKLRPGAMLSKEHVTAIMHLVASSVYRVEVSGVTVIDTAGSLLGPVDDGIAGPRAPAGALAQQENLETRLARRIEEILEPTIGMGRVVARVRAELDWTQKEQTEERFDPDSQVARSETRSTEFSQDGTGRPAGVAGVRSNAPDAAGEFSAPASQESMSRESSTTNYEISKIVSRRIDPVGTLVRLDVAILIDGKPTASAPETDSEEGQPAAAPFVPWSKEELDRFEELARRAVGFSKDRGDEITLTSAPFRTIEMEEDGGFGMDPQLLSLLATLLNYLGLIIACVLFARMVAQPIVNALTSSAGAAFPVTAGDLEASLEGGGGAMGAGAAGVAIEAGDSTGQSIAEQVRDIADSRSDDSVRALRGWLDQQE